MVIVCDQPGIDYNYDTKLILIDNHLIINGISL